jgi:hypothetical protein
MTQGFRGVPLGSQDLHPEMEEARLLINEKDFALFHKSNATSFCRGFYDHLIERQLLQLLGYDLSGMTAVYVQRIGRDTCMRTPMSKQWLNKFLNDGVKYFGPTPPEGYDATAFNRKQI